MPGSYTTPGSSPPGILNGAGTVLSGSLGAGTVLSGNVGSGALGTVHFSSGGIGSGAIGSGQIGNNAIASGAVAAQNLARGAAFASLSTLDNTALFSGVLATPAAMGMYRVSTYAVITQGGLLNAGTLSMVVGWTDETQAQTTSVLTGLALVTSGGDGQGQTVIRTTSGQAINLSVNLSAVTGAPHYNAYGAIERIN